MVDSKSEEDDEEGFGDFTFASFPHHAVQSDQIKGRKSTANDDDDEWGDFVESPLRSVLSSQLSNAQWPSNSSGPSKPLDPFGFFSDHSSTPSRTVATPIESVPSCTKSEKTRWVKLKGALPLSIFGDVEQSGLVDPPVGDATDYVGDKCAGNVRNGSNIAFNDVIANLYTQSQQIKDENGLNSNSNGSNSNLNGVNSNVNGLTYNSSWLNSSSDLFAGNNDGDITQIKSIRGLSSNSDLFAGNNDSQTPQTKAVSGLNSNSDSDLFAGNSDSHGLQIKAVSGLNSYSSGLNSNMDLFSGNIDYDPFTDLYSQSQQNNAENSNALNSNLNASTSNLSATHSNFDGLISYLAPPSGNEELDVNDDGWEFKDAYSEWDSGDGNDKVDGKEQENAAVTEFSSEFGTGSPGSIDLFSASNGLFGKPSEVDIGFDFKPLKVARNDFHADPFLKIEQNGTENGLNSGPVVGTVDFGESFGDFEGACAGAGLKQEGKPKVNGFSHSEVEVLVSDGKDQGKETTSENHKGALPLSIFGDEELETDDCLNVQDTSTYEPSSYPGNGINSQGSNISIHDRISNLYTQSEQIPSVDNTEKLNGNGLVSSGEVLDPSLVNSDDDFDDASWEFMDASSTTIAVDQTSLRSPGDAHEKISTNLKLNNYVDFYCKLKEELFFVCRHHLDSLKKAQNTAALAGEDAKVAAIEDEIQEAYKELHKDNISFKEYPEDQLPRDISLNEFLEVLHGLKFQVLESEYHLSRKLHLAEKDLRSAIELMKHTTSMLNILTLGSMEDQHVYVSTWSKMISVCAQELKHGSWIWKQLVEKDHQSWILSEPQGKRFILALGEIYRVVLVLGASTKLYKPWMLSSPVDSASIYALLQECYTLWSISGIKEALQIISDPIDFEYHITVKAFWESIMYIHDLDVLALGNQVFNQQVSVCRLSLLTSEAVPEMKMLFWSGEYYFLTLANLWANLISCDPPELPHLRVGS